MAGFVQAVKGTSSLDGIGFGRSSPTVTARVHLPMLGKLPMLGPVTADPLLDTFARRIRYLRISVTHRCNYRCHYCMPDGSVVEHSPRSEVLSFEELERIARVFARLGVRKLRLTGGEPTV